MFCKKNDSIRAGSYLRQKHQLSNIMLYWGANRHKYIAVHGIQPPLVRYSSGAEFVHLMHKTLTQYEMLIDRVVYNAFSKTSSTRWSSADSIRCGIADFEEFLDKGVIIILRMTKFHCLRWCLHTNNIIYATLNAVCRTFVNFHGPMEKATAVTQRSVAHCMKRALHDILMPVRAACTTIYGCWAVVNANFMSFDNGADLSVSRQHWESMLWLILAFLDEALLQDITDAIVRLLYFSPICCTLDIVRQAEFRSKFPQLHLSCCL